MSPFTHTNDTRRNDPGYQVFMLLRIGFAVAPILFGLDKFFNWTVDWTQYLAPWIDDIVPGSAQDFMYFVGVVEIAAGLLVLVAPWIGGFVVAAWLGGIVVNLLTNNPPEYYDIALRDFGLFLAALALGRLAWAYRTVPARKHTTVDRAGPPEPPEDRRANAREPGADRRGSGTAGGASSSSFRASRFRSRPASPATPRYDLHRLIELVEQGCPPELAVRILGSPGAEGGRVSPATATVEAGHADQPGRTRHHARPRVPGAPAGPEEQRAGVRRRVRPPARALLLRAARFEVARRRRGLAGAEADTIATEAADDALLAVLRRLDDFRGLSKLTTWAYKFALYEAAVKVRKQAWRDRELPVEPEALGLLHGGSPGPRGGRGDAGAAREDRRGDGRRPHAAPAARCSSRSP